MKRHHYLSIVVVFLATIVFGTELLTPTTAQAHVLNQQTALRRRAANQSGLDLATIVHLDKALNKRGIHFDSLKVKDGTNQYGLRRKQGKLTTRYTISQTVNAPELAVQVVVSQGKRELQRDQFNLAMVWDQEKLVSLGYTTVDGQMVDLLA